MAALNCDLTSLRTASKCFDCLSSTVKQALKTRFMAEALKAMGGTDYTNVNVRNQAAACFTCEPDFALESMELAIWQNLASGKGASLPTTINGLRALVSCTPCGEQKSTRAAQILLLCQLNAKGL